MTGPFPKGTPLAVRLWGRTQISESGCVEWTGGTDRSGYGAIKVAGKQKGTHILAWELSHTELIPVGICVLHQCDNRVCINVGHLFLGTKGDNARDRDAKGRNGFSNKTHCVRNHPLSGDNVRIDKRGKRRCLACQRIWNETNKKKASQSNTR